MLLVGDYGGWRGVIGDVLVVEGVLALAGILLHPRLPGIDSSPDMQKARAIVSALYLLAALVLVVTLLRRAAPFGVIYGAAFFNHFRDAWTAGPRDPTPLVARSSLALALLIGIAFLTAVLADRRADVPVIIGAVYFLSLAVAEVTLGSWLAGMRMPRE